MIKIVEFSNKSQVLHGKNVSDHLCHFGRTSMAEVNICGTSSIYFGPLYKYFNMTSTLFMTEVVLAEVAVAKNNTSLKIHLFHLKSMFFMILLLLLATVTSAHTTSVMKRAEVIFKYL